MPRGVKTCPQCKKTTGPRSRACACGWNFSKQENKPAISIKDGKLNVKVPPRPPLGIETPPSPTRTTVAGLIKKLGLAVLLTEVIDYCLAGQENNKPAAHQQVAFKLNGATAKAHEYNL